MEIKRWHVKIILVVVTRQATHVLNVIRLVVSFHDVVSVIRNSCAAPEVPYALVVNAAWHVGRTKDTMIR